MRSRPALVVVLAAAALAAPAPARAEKTAARAEKSAAGPDPAGERYGGLVPEGATTVRVDRASVAFELFASVASAAVTATYQLRNTGAEAESTDVAFAFTRGAGDDDPGARVTVTVDGVSLPMRTQRDVDLLGPRLNGWVDDHPDIDRALRAPDAPDGAARLQGLVEAAGGRCADGCRHLVAWHRSLNGDEELRLPASAEDEALLGAVREAMPGAFAELADHWTALGGRAGHRLGFLLFHVDFAPGQARAVTLRYVHRAEVLETGDVSSTYGFDYPFAPARRWAGFGPLDVSVHVPGRARFSARPALERDGEREGETWRASFPGLVGGDPQTPGPAGLPTRDLRFEVMSLEGLWLGMTEPGGYRALAAAAIAAAAIAVGGAAGRAFGGGARWRRVVVPLLTGAPLAAVCSLAVLVLLLLNSPPHALGVGYRGIAGGGLLVLLSAPLGALAAAVVAARRARRAPADG